MARYIDADKIPYFHYSSDETAIEGVEYTLKGVIKNRVPTEDVAPVVHGCWKDIYQRDLYIPDEKTTMTLTEEKCSNCSIVTKFIGDKLFLNDFVCPNCGAKMDGDTP